jgi:hypothetical protein
VVQRVERHAGWRTVPPGFGGENMRVGPATLHTEDGRRLKLLPGTGGGTACLEFVQTAEDRLYLSGDRTADDDRLRRDGRLPERCAIVGRLRRPDEVLWFRMVGEVSADNLVELTDVEEADERVVKTRDGLTWAVATSRQLDCLPTVTRIADATKGRFGGHAYLNIKTQQVARIGCIASD